MDGEKMAAVSKEIRELSQQPWFPIMMRELGYEPIKYGHWIHDNGLYKCSVCNNFTITGWANCIPIEQMNKTMKYCNNCGARMDEVKHG